MLVWERERERERFWNSKANDLIDYVLPWFWFCGMNFRLTCEWRKYDCVFPLKDALVDMLRKLQSQIVRKLITNNYS